MADFSICIKSGVAEGAISREMGQELLGSYRDAVDAHAGSGPIEADKRAAAAVMEALGKAKVEAARQQALMIRTRRDILDGIAGLKERRGYTNVTPLGDGGEPPRGGWVQGGEPPKDGPFKNGAQAAKALTKLWRNKGGLSGAPLKGSVEGRALAIRGLLDAKMADVMEKFQSHLGFDSPNRAQMPNIIREAFGEETGDASAKQLAGSWSEAAEFARRLFNEAGGSIGKIDAWGMPQVHDAAAMYRAGVEAWVGFTAPLLDRNKMVDRLTGAPFTEKRLAAKLRDTYGRIQTRGLIDREPGAPIGQGMLGNQRAEERFLVFKGADAWQAYQAKFGAADGYAAMVRHLDDMAHDIAQMQILGPNPEHQWQWLKNFATREAAIEHLNGAEGAERAARGAIKNAQLMADSFTGKSSVPVNEKLAASGGNVRSFLNGADLGGAVITDMSSAWMFGGIARTFMGVKWQGDMGQLAGLLADPAVRADARRLGFINEAARDGMVGATQDSLRSLTVGERSVNGLNTFARKYPSSVMRLQGLSGSFEARMRSFRMSFSGALADASQKGLADLGRGSAQEKTLAQELDARAFSEADWDAIRSTPLWTPRAGVQFLRPADIADHAGVELAARVGEMVLNAEQYAVPVSSSLWTRSQLTMGQRPGTLAGEAVRSLSMFRTFLINAQHNYAEEIFLRGVARGYGGFGLAAWCSAWAAGIFGALTLSGAMAVQVKQLTRGLDPLPMNSPQFWGAAILQGGGLGLLGDFFFSSHARNDKSAPIAAIGPVGELASDAWDLTGGELQDLATRGQHPGGHDHEVARVAHDLAAYTPGSSLWWARLAFDRGIVDQLHQAMDPDASYAFARSAATMERQRGSGAWWPKGEMLPQRAPDMGAMAGAAPQ